MKALVRDKSTVSLQTYLKPTLDSKDSILIKVAIAGLCRTDMYVANGLMKTPHPIIPGHEFSGVVEAVSQDVIHVAKGQRVAVFPFYMHESQWFALGVDVDGAFAEYVKVPASCVFPIPDSLSFKEAAYLEPICASMAVLKLSIKPSERGVILGENRIAALTKMLLDLHGFENIEIREVNDSLISFANTYDYVIETEANEQAIASAVSLVKPKGLVILKSRPPQSIPFPLHQIVKKEIKMEGAYYADFQKGIELLSKHQIDFSAFLGETYSLEDAVDILLGQKQVETHRKIFFEPS